MKEIDRHTINNAVASMVPEGAYPRNNHKFGIDIHDRWDENDELIKREFAESFELADDEYIDEKTGLIMCKFCKTPRQKFIGSCFGWMHLDCDCLELLHAVDREKEKIKERAKDCRRIAFEEYPVGRKFTFFNDDRKNKNATAIAMNYCTEFETRRHERKNGLIIWGNVGTGKTFLATAIMNEIIDRYGLLVKFVRISDLVSSVSDYRTSKNAFEPYKSCAALVLDDFGVEQSDKDGRTLSAMVKLLDFCENFGIPLIITTNLQFEDFTSHTSDLAFHRVTDRIRERSEFVGFRGESRRAS